MIATSDSPPQTVSSLLRELQSTVAGGGTVTVGSMLQLFGVRGFAFLIFVLALMNVVIFMVPGLSLVFGLPLVILTVQMVLGFRTPLFPSFVRSRAIDKHALARGLAVGVRGMARVEHLIKPRFAMLSGPHFDRVHSLLALLLAVLMAIPVPIMNLPPSFGLIVLALGLMQRDGIFIAAAYAIAVWSLWLFGSLGHVAHILAQ
ncbi:MAG: exopolysaccharide biosynthesis protein [Alphaproteobacteria bacterium]|nr:exopolysaccharide biosynthesis protein [Alphaproteobacteria bacterium]